MKFIRVLLVCLIWIVLLIPQLILMTELSGYLFAISMYSYCILAFTTFAISNSFEIWFKSKIK